MKRYTALWRDTWWLWAGLVSLGVVLAIWVEWVFLVALPISLFAFFYFGLMRYDDEGNQVGDRFNP